MFISSFKKNMQEMHMEAKQMKHFVCGITLWITGWGEKPQDQTK